MTAHTKVDRQTGEAFAFTHNHRHPFLTYFKVNPSGVKQKEVPLFSLQRPSFVRDFAVTKNYAIFPDIQILLKPAEISKGKKPLVTNPQKMILKCGGLTFRDSTCCTQLMHGKKTMATPLLLLQLMHVLSPEHVVEHMNFLYMSLQKIIIDVGAKRVERYPLSTKNLDFGVINPAYSLNKNRYIYAGIVEYLQKVEGVVKIDLSLPTTDCTVATRLYGPGCYGGEPIFVPRERNNSEEEEDDGYLVTYVHDENKNESKFLVMDAKSPTLEIIAAVKLPRRVPYGFHGIFVPDNELKKL